MKIGKLVLGVGFAVTAMATSSISYSGSCTQYGNTVYCDNGTSATRYGNTTYGSDGSSRTRYGNTTYGY